MMWLCYHVNMVEWRDGSVAASALTRMSAKAPTAAPLRDEDVGAVQTGTATPYVTAMCDMDGGSRRACDTAALW